MPEIVKRLTRMTHGCLQVAVALVIAGVAVAPALGAPAVRTPIDGRWQATITRAALIRTGEVSAASAGRLYGPYTAQFAAGRFRFHNARTGLEAAGTFTVAGKLATFVYAHGVGLERGSRGVCAFSVFRDRLTFAKLPERPCHALQATVWTSIR